MFSGPSRGSRCDAARPPRRAPRPSLVSRLTSLVDDVYDRVRPAEVEQLRRRLRTDPNDVRAFERLVHCLLARRTASGDRSTTARADVVRALAEDLMGDRRAWYPLVVMARLELGHDREAALRRLGTASDRDPTGMALARGLAVLRDAGLPTDALRLGTGHWRARRHVLGAGREMVLAAVEAGHGHRVGRLLSELAGHPDRYRARVLVADLERRGARSAPLRVERGPEAAERQGAVSAGSGSSPVGGCTATD